MAGFRAMWALEPAAMAYPPLYGDGRAGEHIARWLLDHAAELR